MKKSYISIIVMTVAILCGCTQNNGHIGPIFGSWALVGIEDAGKQIPLEGETVFSFQNEVLQVMRLESAQYTEVTKYGNFTISDNVLILKFQNHPTESGNYMYMTPDWIHLPLDGNPIKFDVKKLSGSEMILILNSEEKPLTYSFKKTW